MTNRVDALMCPECGKSGFKNYSGLAGHLASVHRIRLGAREKSILLHGRPAPAGRHSSPLAQPKAKQEKKGRVERELGALVPVTTAKSTESSEQFSCPECGKAFKNRGGLGSHMLYVHQASASAAKSIPPAQIQAPTVTGPQSTPSAAPTANSPTSNPTRTGAHEHLRAAREELVQRDQEIDTELARLTGLQGEKERVRRELDAVNAALQVFVDSPR